MKKKFYLLIIAIIISFIFGSIVFNEQSQQNQQRQAANNLFISCLVQANADGFEKDYNKMDDDSKNYYYITTASNLYTASNLLDLTSYNKIKNRNQLFSAIYDLYLCMTHNDTRWIVVTEKSTLISKYLTNIIQNPNDVNDCDALSKLAEDLYTKR